ncbi:hypothetical protein BGZ49_010318 [Haplosporangium sp. Z 27]|nr:hypothetical protein BGZ49_010318 [Haplosporangium sp. Z 27]
MAEKRKEVRYIAQKFANAILADFSPYVISTDGLQALNAFLDELLFILIDTAKGLETNRIKAAVYQTFPTALGKDSIVESELEAKSYIDMGGKDTNNHMSNNGLSGTSSMFNADSDETRVEQVFEQFRAKCQYYSKLGERLGSPAGNPNNSIVVPTLIAIYVTAVLEHVAEYVLQIASTIADRQDHADLITVREVYVALSEDRQIENIFATMILKTQLQKRFRNSLIMPGTGSRPEEQTPATVKRSGSWGKQLRLGNSDKPKLEVNLPTDLDDDDIFIDPNRPQFGDWDEPPDAENKQKKKNDFEMLFSSGETMKVSLTPNRLRTIEVHRKNNGPGGVATRSSSRAASVLNVKSHARRPSTPGENIKKNAPVQDTINTVTPPPLPTAPSVPALPANINASQSNAKKQGQHSVATAEASKQSSTTQGLGISDNANKKSNQQETAMDGVRSSTSTFDSQITMSTAAGSSATSQSPISSRSPIMPSGAPKYPVGSLKGTSQATNELEQLLNNSSPKSSIFDPSQIEPPLTPTSETSKKENPIKNFMGRLGRNSMQRTSSDNNSVANSPTSIRSFNITGGNVQSSSTPGSAAGSTNGSVNSGFTGQTSIMSTASAPAAYHMEQQGSGNHMYDQQQQQQQQAPPAIAAKAPNRPSPQESRQPASDSNNNKNIKPLNTVSPTPNGQSSHPSLQHPRPITPEVNTVPIPSRNASLNHDITSPTKPNFSGNYETRPGIDAALPRPLSPRPVSPRPSSPRPTPPRPHSPLQTSQSHFNRSNTLDGQSGGIISPSPLSHSVSGSNISPSSSSTSLITPGKVQHIQERLTKTAQLPGFKPQDHLQKHPNRISLEGTIRANPFYQQDRNSSVRSSLVDLSSSSNNNSTETIIPPKSTSSPAQADSDVDSSNNGRANGVASKNVASSDSDSDIDSRQDRGNAKDGMVSPATSPEMGSFKDRLPSATTRTLTAAAAAAKQQQQQQKQHTVTPPTSEKDSQSQAGVATSIEQESGPMSPTEHSSIVSENGLVSRQFQVYDEKNPPVVEQQVEEQVEEEEEVPYVAPVPRNLPTSSSSRHSIFVDEAAQAMDALSRARHRQSMRLENGEEGDFDSDDSDDMNEIAPPEKWHYSDLEDDEDDEDEDDDEYTPNSPHRRRRHDSFMSAKSVLANGSTVSLVDASNDTQDEDEEKSETKEQLVRSLDVQQQQEEQKQQNLFENQDLKSSDFVKGSEYANLDPAVDTQDEDQNGGDEDESEDSEDLEDDDDEEGQDRRIYLQNLRAQKREARRQERLAAGETGKVKKGRSSTKDGSSIDATSTATTTSTDGTNSKKAPKKGQSKENRPQTPTTPVPTTQIIPLTPTDLVLIRQKLFAAGNFEASMRMLDTIFHAAMAKMVEGRERGVQTEPIDFLDQDLLKAETTATEESKDVAGVSTSTLTDNNEETQPQKQLQWVEVVATPVATVEDDDDEDRVVEWLLGGV